jgi:hypothetical protein
MVAPQRRTGERAGLARRGWIAAPLALACALAGCESEPCVGPACDIACSDELCAAGGEDQLGSGGTSAGTGGAPAGGRSGSAGTGSGTAGPCKGAGDCDTAHGFECVQGECRHACRSHYDCAGEGACEPLAGEPQYYCNLDSKPEAGTYDYCPNGDECPAPYVCLGSGQGDSRAYCSKPCPAGDQDCAPGFFCDLINDGSADVPFCVRRSFCASCTSDADCLAVPGQICARDQTGEKICTKPCDPAVVACAWGNASVCGTWDSERGVATCAHRFGTCRGTGKSCEPCSRDADCPRGFCHGSAYTGERWCVDQSVTCDCEGLEDVGNVCEDGNGCPDSPGGAPMMCFDDQRFTGDPFAHHCFGASTSSGASLASPQTGCWDPP